MKLKMNKPLLHTTWRGSIECSGKKPDTRVYMLYDVMCMSLNVSFTSVKVYLKFKKASKYLINK